MGISRNIAILIGSGAVRNLGFGFYNVIFAIYLSKLGFGTVTIGTVVTVASLSGVRVRRRCPTVTCSARG